MITSKLLVEERGERREKGEGRGERREGGEEGGGRGERREGGGENVLHIITCTCIYNVRDMYNMCIYTCTVHVLLWLSCRHVWWMNSLAVECKVCVECAISCCYVSNQSLPTFTATQRTQECSSSLVCGATLRGFAKLVNKLMTVLTTDTGHQH